MRPGIGPSVIALVVGCGVVRLMAGHSVIAWGLKWYNDNKVLVNIFSSTTGELFSLLNWKVEDIVGQCG